MGRKVHPSVFRFSSIKKPNARWFASDRQTFQDFLKSDVGIRKFLTKKLKDASVDHIDIERTNKVINIVIHSGKPGFIIGRSGAGIEELKQELLKKFFRGKRVTINVNVIEVKKAMLSAAIVAQQVATEIERRFPFRRSMKNAAGRVMQNGGKGVRVVVGGRLNGADIARSESVSQGTIPLSTLRADIDYAHREASTVYGVIGVKVWINRGEVFETEEANK